VAGRLAGTGTISPGLGAGTLTIQGGLDLSGGGNYVWELATNSTDNAGVNFDLISLTAGNLSLGSTSRISLSFVGSATTPGSGDPFWSYPHTWRVVALSGSSSNVGLTRFGAVLNGTFGNARFTNYADSSGIVLAYDPGYSPFYALYDIGPGFFAGENVAVTNGPGLSISVWSAPQAMADQSILNWTLEGQMQEQPLHDGTGNSRYSINLNPASSPVYYIAGRTQSGPYAPTVAVEWITTDDFGNYAVVQTNVAINAAGVLALPLGPVITQDPTNQTVLAGHNARFAVAATPDPLAYQWWFNNAPLAGAVTATNTLAGVTAIQAGPYFVVVSNSVGSVTSAIAILTVAPQPRASVQLLSNGLQITASAVAGDAFWVQTATNLLAPVSWATLATNVVDGTAMARFTDTNTPSRPRLFYRLVFP
jgi:hypothetical protein